MSLAIRPPSMALPLAGRTVDDGEIARVAKALAHPARVRIVRLLLERQSCIGGDIVEEIGLAQSTVSEHLRVLKAAGVITGEIERPRVCYSLNPRALAPLAGMLVAILERGETGMPAGADCCPASGIC
ncbi:MAG: winged helix-turn-helix transcriptional regulator [Bauldia sp.]|nr:winged helix-turn-helix transcriptional regulator [Bauldia sp.]